jgi:hypothetical protein
VQQISLPQATKGAGNVWGHTTGAVPDKNELTTAYAAAFDCDGDIVVYFGADRIATDGQAFLGFWFLQQDIVPLSDGSFSGRHQDDDTLVLVNFDKGCVVPNIGVFQWRAQAGDGDIKDGNTPILKTLVDPNTTAIKCDPDTTTGKELCAVTNDPAIPLF